MAESRTDTRPPGRPARPLQDQIFNPWVLLPLTAILGLVVTYLFFHPTLRWIKLLFGLAFVLTIIRLPLSKSVKIFLVIFPAPTFVFFGDTNFIFILLLLILWMSRQILGWVERPISTPITYALVAYAFAHLVSFLNVTTFEGLSGGLVAVRTLFSAAVLYILLINATRSENQLRTLLQALCVTSLFVDITGLYEAFSHGKSLVPESFLYTMGSSEPSPGRAGAIFGSHGLLADFSSFMFYVQLLLGMESKRTIGKIYYFSLAALGAVMITLAVNRGGILIWMAGGLMYLWYMRRRLRLLLPMIALPAVAALLITGRIETALNLQKLRIVTRLVGTTFIHGIPETRVRPWTQIIPHLSEHPIIGHGPYFEHVVGIETTVWPHNAYLFYIYTVGTLGLLAFLWMLFKLIWITRPANLTSGGKRSFSASVLVVAHIQLLMFAASQIRTDHQRGNVYVYVMWILFALATISARLVREQTRAKRAQRLAAEAAARGPRPAYV